MTALNQNTTARGEYAENAFLGGNAPEHIRDLQTKEVEKNSEVFFSRLLPELLKEHRDKYALMKNGEVAGIFPDFFAAIDEGKRRYEHRMFSVQKITDRPVRIWGPLRAVK